MPDYLETDDEIGYTTSQLADLTAVMKMTPQKLEHCAGHQCNVFHLLH